MISVDVKLARFARPYARAVFDYAQEQQQLAAWSDRLRIMAEYIQQPCVRQILRNPEYSVHMRCEAILALGQSVLDQAGQNFIKILAHYQRLLVLPDIYLLFEQFRAAVEKTLSVQVKSAVTLSVAQIEKLKAALAKKFGQAVELVCEIDPALLGGFIVSAGDRVMDVSVRGQFEKLKEAVLA
jgi:F-type H+-transporting ATPase subunit delta